MKKAVASLLEAAGSLSLLVAQVLYLADLCFLVLCHHVHFMRLLTYSKILLISVKLVLVFKGGAY